MRAIDRLATSDAADDASNLAPETKEPGSTPLRASYVWALLALVLGLFASGTLHYAQWRQLDAEWRAQQTDLAQEGMRALSGQLSAAERLLRMVQSLYLASDEVSPSEFRHMYQNMRPRERFPSLQALAFAARERTPDGPRFITRVVAPERENQAIVGLDVSSQLANMNALLRAEDADQLAMSAPFTLAQTDGRGRRVDGITLRLPIYGPGPSPSSFEERVARLIGSIAVSFRVGALILDALPADTRAAFRVRINDVSNGERIVLVDANAEQAPARPAYRHVAPLHFGGRIWQVEFDALQSAPALAALHPALPAGLLASILLALLVFSGVRTRQHAVTLAERMSARYRDSEARFRVLNELLPALVLLADRAQGRVTYANQASRRRLGSDLVGSTIGDLFVDRDGVRAKLMQGDDGDSTDALMRTSRGEEFWARVSVADATVDGRDALLVVATDVTEQRQLTETLTHQATHDALTELTNRREFERRLENTLADVAHDGALAVVLYIDLDQFKLVNDTSGHLAGDHLLMQLADVLRERLADADVLARLGGDEFGVLKEGLRNSDEAHALAERARLAVAEFVFRWESLNHAVSASIGAVLVDRAGMRMVDLLARVDTACYMAKELGRNRVHFHSAHDYETSRRRQEMRWANRLRWAAEQHRLVLMYQEIHQLDADPTRAVGVELLLRYRDDEGHLATPGAFMAAAERYGLMPSIDRWVVESALANFHALHPADDAIRLVSINLSGASVEDDAFAERIIELIKRHRIDPERVCFEVTETVAVRNLSQVARFIGRLRSEGCKCALDDFGAGMSSFSYLKHLPVDIIKIDGGFVRDMLIDPVSHAMVRAVAEIGQNLNLRVVAEWVADEPTVRALVALGIRRGQGFALHRPQLASFEVGADS